MVEITPALIGCFRYEMRAFQEPATFPSDIISMALSAADHETGGSGWGPFGDEPFNLKRRGMFLFAAAWMTALYGQDATQSPAGEARLNIAAKSVGDESIQYRVAAMMDAGNDFLTYSIYGQEFYRIRPRAYLGAMAL